MLSTTLIQHYQLLRQAILSLQSNLSQLDPIALKAAVDDLQQSIQQAQVMASDELSTGDPSQEGLLRSLHTEMVKQLKLLALDSSFLQVARQPTTRQQRQQQMSDRLTQLLGYCDYASTLITQPT